MAAGHELLCLVPCHWASAAPRLSQQTGGAPPRGTDKRGVEDLLAGIFFPPLLEIVHAAPKKDKMLNGITFESYP